MIHIVRRNIVKIGTKHSMVNYEILSILKSRLCYCSAF